MDLSFIRLVFIEETVNNGTTVFITLNAKVEVRKEK